MLTFTSQPPSKARPIQAGAVSWRYGGATDPLVGTGATAAERMVGYGSAAVLTVLIVGADLMRADPVAGTLWQLAILAFFAYDIAGGAAANMLNSCKRLYHSAPSPQDNRLVRALKNPWLFTAIHIHPVLIALCLGGSVAAALVWYALLQSAVWLVLCAPLYLRRGLATALTMVAIVLAQVWLPLGAGLEWVVPALFIKMVMGHAVQEEPYAGPGQDRA